MDTTLEIGAEVALELRLTQVRPESMDPVPRVSASLRATEEQLEVRFRVLNEIGFAAKERAFQGHESLQMRR